jgi:hypothetical protein
MTARRHTSAMAGVIIRLVLLTLLLAACSAPQPVAPAPTLPPTPAVIATPTTIVVIITVPPVATAPRPVPSPIPALSGPTPAAGPENPLRLSSDGISTPPAFRLAGGDYVFAWEVPRPPNPAGCYFGAMLQSEPSVSPFTLQLLGPWTVEPTDGYAGSRRINGLGSGGYMLRPGGDCPWTITITPLRGRA